MRITRRQLRSMIEEAAGPTEKSDLKDAIFAYMKSSIEQTTPDADGAIPDKDVEAAIGELSSDAEISAEEYVDSDPDQLGISSLGEAKIKITERQLRQMIKEELLAERGTGNPALQREEQEIRMAVENFYDKYMMTMQGDPSNPRDLDRVKTAIFDNINAVLDVL